MQKFVNLHADIVPPPPSFFKGVGMSIFTFHSPIEKLQAVCDSWLNEATGGALYFEPLFPYANVIFADYAGVTATTAPYSGYGYVPYKEVVISFYVGRYDLSGGGKKLLQVYNLVDYAWVDENFTLLGGQLTYGMKKNLGVISFSSVPVTGYALSSLSFKTYDKSAAPALNEILAVTAGPPAQVIRESSGVLEAAEMLLEVLKDLLHPVSFSLLEEFFNLFVHREIPFVSLRQLRSIQTSENAVYQEIITFTCKLDHLYSFKLPGKDFTLVLNQVDTFPVADDYGWSAQNQPSLVIQAEMDFTFETGSILWQSTPIT